MKTSHLLSLSLLPLALVSASDAPLQPQTLDPNLPIYIGHVFWPPSMTFLAWLPSPAESKHTSQTEWCYYATDASNHALFSVGGIDSLQIHNYFDDQAYITREGKRWADCRVTPESGRMGACTGVEDWDCEGKPKYTGPGTRGWSCWVNDKEALLKELAGHGTGKVNGTQEQNAEAILTTSEVVIGAMASSSLVAAFTPGVTGS